MPAPIPAESVDELVRSRRRLLGSNTPTAAEFISPDSLLFTGADASLSASRPRPALHFARLPPRDSSLSEPRSRAEQSDAGAAEEGRKKFYSPPIVPWTEALCDETADEREVETEKRDEQRARRVEYNEPLREAAEKRDSGERSLGSSHAGCEHSGNWRRCVSSFQTNPSRSHVLLPQDDGLYVASLAPVVSGSRATPRRVTPRRGRQGRGSRKTLRNFETEQEYADVQLSPDGSMASFVRSGDLWVVDIASGRERRLTYSENFEARDGEVLQGGKGSHGNNGEREEIAGEKLEAVRELLPKTARQPDRVEYAAMASFRAAEKHGESGVGEGRKREAPLRARTCGVVDYISAEELGRTTASWWRPERSAITGNYQLLYLAVDSSDTDVATIPTYDSSASGVERFYYAKPGGRNCVTEPAIVDVPPVPDEVEDAQAWEREDPRDCADTRSWAPAVGIRDAFGRGGEYVVSAGWLAESALSSVEGVDGAFWLQLLDRAQKKMEVVVFPVQHLTVETPEMERRGFVVVRDCCAENRWLNVGDGVKFLNQSQGVLFETERDGFKHIYHKEFSVLAEIIRARDAELIGAGVNADRRSGGAGRSDAASWSDSSDSDTIDGGGGSRGGGDGRHSWMEGGDGLVPGVVHRVTSGDSWMVEDVLFIDESRELVYFSSTIRSPLERQLCVSSYAAGSQATDLTQLTSSGFTHSGFTFDESGTRVFISFSSRHVPTQSVVYDITGLDGHCISEVRLFEIARLGNPLTKPTSLAVSAPEIFDFLADDGVTRLYGALYLPRASGEVESRAPSKAPHATILVVYAGPRVQTVRNEWQLTMQLKNQMLASHGYAVVAIDGRGSSRRGVEFEAVFAEEGFGNVEIRDQVSGVEFLIAKGIVDPRRLGCTGWSYGAYAGCMLLAKYSHLFLFAVCGAAVVKFEDYNVGYSEKYLGMPCDNALRYSSSSILSYVQSFPDVDGRLMLIHSVLDENVHCAQTLELVNALVRLNKPHSLVLYPKENHGLRLASSQLHFESTFLRFVDSAVKKGRK